MSDENEDDENPQLSTSTLALLQQFYTERDAQARILSTPDATKNDEEAKDHGPLSMSAFAEDWNASQFWCTEETARGFAEALLSTSPSTIAVISAPSTFAALKQILHTRSVQSADDNDKDKDNKDNKGNDAGTSLPPRPTPEITLLEFDERFAVWPEFVAYDYNQPTRLPAAMKGRFDAIMLDPPFLSEECQTKFALTVRWLARSWSPTGFKLVICTGERMAGLIARLYGKIGIQQTDFKVVHGTGLSNEFITYTNFQWQNWNIKK